jgi:hypothetical protein
MTPQERDLVTSLLERLKAQGGQPKDPEADALIRRAVGEQPDAPYLLAQTVIIEDMALNAAQRRIAELARQLAAATASPPAPPASFLPSAARGSVPSAGWTTSRQPPTSPASSPVWSQSGATAAGPGPVAAPAAPAMAAPFASGVAGSGFLRQAATTAAGIAGGALLFQGIESLFGPHYGSGGLAGLPAQPGISETVTNNYYGEPGARQADADQDDRRDSDGDAADQDVPDTDLADDGGDDLDSGDYDDV